MHRGGDTMEVSLLYGKGELKINVPDHSVIVEPKNIPGLKDEMLALNEALLNPIGTLPIHEMVKETDKVAIVISDITRPTPNEKIVPAIINALPHVPKENFIIINGTGTHRDQTEEEFIQMLGEDIVKNIRIINNNCHDQSTQIKIGTSKFGCDVWLNSEYVEADFRIVTGFIEPHFFAGFSGGPKGIMPGIAGIETIMTFHNAKMIGHPLATWGNMINNPLQEMTREINGMCKPHFMLNVTLNREKKITNVFAGDLIKAHDLGCAYVKEHTMVRCAERFDVVITSNSGYPLDQNLYQAVKGMSAAQKIVKEGGTIICAAECIDGLPNHGNYAEILQMRKTPQELLQMINDESFKKFDQWQVQKQAVIQVWADVHLYSTLTEEQVKNSMLNYVKDIEELLEQLKGKYGPNYSIAILPIGPLTIPYVEE